ncbi:SNF2 family N-terminal domain-containing protein [Mycena alexandri]|uniref:SNF2 family N-terminal domain-containing protein n=1 Tax=Mycena alexandri TaxID=1745969 RepID=A0AAD6X3T5_9AGAR|nr:SNF2 family N-terminal domain-containing protein [Mycena alexandri]
MSRKSTKGKTTQTPKTEDVDFKAFLSSQQPPPPRNFSFPFSANRSFGQEEEIPLPLPDTAHNKSFKPGEAEEALKALFGGSTHPDSSPSTSEDSDGVVSGFRKGVRLLPHQIAGRAWMRDREDFTKKKAGGILADDMGVGKTIQALTSIVDRPATKRDKEEGWSGATLVVCPLGVLQHWGEEITKVTVGLKVIQYHGTARERQKVAPLLRDADVVLTTYGLVCSEHSTVVLDEPERGSVLYTTKWWRIILDEAHTIKNRATKTAEGCCDLRAKFRWCLTATPMQNKVEEFFPLLKFLRIKPLNEWERFNTLIATPLSKGHSGGSLAMKRLQVVLKHVMLRRTKIELDSLLKLPQRNVVVLPCKFDPSEQQFYTALKANVQTLIQKILAKKSGGSAYMNVLVLLLRLRQTCDHPSLVLDNYETEMDDASPGAIPSMLSNDADFEDDLDTGKPKCQMCTTRLTRRNTADNAWPGHCINCAALKVQAQNLRSPMRASAKIRAIVRLIKHIAAKSDGREKTVIFSQFTAMLDVIEPFLSAIGVDYVRYDGSMSVKERTQALVEIDKDPRKTVMLVSLKAGGVGLNLTACNHVILVDMWWNPAVEEQAFDRTHRVGQTRNVYIYKLKINDTVEDRILELQERKRELTKIALSGNHVKNKELPMHELLELFK